MCGFDAVVQVVSEAKEPMTAEVIIELIGATIACFGHIDRRYAGGTSALSALAGKTFLGSGDIRK